MIELFIVVLICSLGDLLRINGSINADTYNTFKGFLSSSKLSNIFFYFPVVIKLGKTYFRQSNQRFYVDLYLNVVAIPLGCADINLYLAFKEG